MYLRHFKLIAQVRGINSDELHKSLATSIRTKNTTKFILSKKMPPDLMDTEPGGENTQ